MMMTKPTTNIAALDCTLQSGYLIEASAGTGKTWTLTGIILRLLIEKKYPPERIVATTFTRAAAAEMQERIGQRLHDFYALIRWLKSMQQHYPDWFGEQNFDENLPQIQESAKSAGVDAQDPIHIHLLKILLNDVKALDETIYRTSLLLTTLDKLFVGTLDSLTQKWLKEFSSQIGYQADTQISNDERQHILSIVHDWLRAEEVRLRASNPILHKIINKNYKIFSSVEVVADDINHALQFYSAPIDESYDEPTTWQILREDLDDILQADYADLMAFCSPDYCQSVGMAKRKYEKLADFVAWQSLLDVIDEHGMAWQDYLNDEQRQLVKFIKENDDYDKFFNKNHDVIAKDKFIQVWSKMLKIAYWQADLDAFIGYYLTDCMVQIAQTARQKLAPMLENKKQSTFTLQMVRLLDALQNNPSLAKHIRHHYPVALIDESQDVNGLQVQLLQAVYLEDMLNYQLELKRYQALGGDKPEESKGFLLLVGDPKQAIYRFRGGDVSNYNLLKHYGEKQCGQAILNRSLVLDVNRRSNRALIESLNEWFVDNGQQELANHTYLGTGIFYQPITAFKDEQRLSWQHAKKSDDIDDILGNKALSILHFGYDDKQNVDKVLALHINTILKSSHTLGGKKVRPQDIAILAKRNSKLNSIKAKLNKLGIPAVAAQDENVFDTDAGRDLYALIAAVVNPNHHGNLGRLLTSKLIGLNLEQAMCLLNDDGDASNDEVDLMAINQSGKCEKPSFDKLDLLTFLKRILEKWQSFGLAAALNDAFLHSPSQTSSQAVNQASNLWLDSARLGERYLADMWQLIELIGTERNLHERQILTWYQAMMQTDIKQLADEQKRQTLPSEIGVNLMTIHKSKGLEFPIVYVLELDSAIKAREQAFYPYSDREFNRRLSPVEYKDDNPDYFKKSNHQEEIEEFRRLGYVALTRASEQIFVVATDSYNKTDIATKPLYQWLEGTGNAKLNSENRLSDVVHWQSFSGLGLSDDKTAQNDKSLHKTSENWQAIDYVDWQEVMPQTYFTGVRQTSFTALVSRLDKSISDELAVSADYDQLSVLTDLEETLTHEQPLNNTPKNIRQSFLRGANAGDFLHKVLQFAKRSDELSATIDEQVKRLGLPSKYASQKTQVYLTGQALDDGEHQALVAWLNDAFGIPFLSSQAALADLDGRSQVRELGFTLGMRADFSLAKLNEVFAKYSDKSLALLEDDTATYRYLRGEIDLVYEHQGRFYVVDYKSNYLGDNLADYQSQSLQNAMDKAGYWLQAAIYQVALHRLLSIKLPDYRGNERRYLGAVEYVFLRGLNWQNPEYGHLLWQPPFELIVALDKIL